MTGKMVTIRLSEKNARLVAQNIDGWIDAGSCKGGLRPDENRALSSAFSQIMRQLPRTSVLRPLYHQKWS